MEYNAPIAAVIAVKCEDVLMVSTEGPNNALKGAPINAGAVTYTFD